MQDRIDASNEYELILPPDENVRKKKDEESLCNG